MTETAKQLRMDIQGLRGLAILLVIALHAGFAPLPGGYVGVEVFFVISGYVVTASMLRKDTKALKFNLRNFYVKRVLRILPSSTAVIIATVFAAVLFLGPAFNSDLFTDAKWAAFFATNFRLIDTGANYFIAGLDKSLLTHYWYLAIENQVYLVYPLMVFVIWRLTPARASRPVLASLLLVSLALSGFWSITMTLSDSVTAYYSPLTRIWELALGGLVALVPLRMNHARTWLRNVTAVLGLATISAVAVLFDAGTAYPGYLAALPAFATAAIIWAGTAEKISGPNLWLGFRPLAYLGEISYSLYLWHFGWLYLPTLMPDPPTGWWVLPLQFAGAFGSAILSHHFLENPIRKSRLLNQDGWATLLFAAVCLVLIWDATLAAESLWLNL